MLIFSYKKQQPSMPRFATIMKLILAPSTNMDYISDVLEISTFTTKPKITFVVEDPQSVATAGLPSVFDLNIGSNKVSVNDNG